MEFTIITSAVEPIIFKKPSDKYDYKWWVWQLENNGFVYNDNIEAPFCGRFAHKDMPNITINCKGGEISICLWYNNKTGVQLFATKMRNSKKAIDFIKNELDYNRYKKWLN